MRGKLLKIAVILFCIINVFCVFAGVEKLVRYVKSASNDSSLSGSEKVPDYSGSSLTGSDEVRDYSGSYLSGDVKVLKEKRRGYVMQITAENNGENGVDFTGTVQVIFSTPYFPGPGGKNSVNCAYNTEITLPVQGKKQFTITVPDFTVENRKQKGSGQCALNFIDEGGNVIQSISLENVFDYLVKEIPVGVLSDNFEGLQYMSMDGRRDIRVYNSGFCTLKLVSLNNNNIREKLDELYFLIIDQFNVSLLSEEDIKAIQDWVKAGGWLLIGTGEYAEQTLSGFDKDFIDVDVLGISEPGEENILTTRNYKPEYNEIDFTNMTVVELKDSSTDGYFYISHRNPSICSSIGDGAVMIFNFSLGENELKKLDSYAIEHIYNEVKGEYYSTNTISFEDCSNISENLMAFMDRDDFTGRDDYVDIVYVSSAERNLALIWFFGGLLIIIIISGIQRKYTVRKWYWICAYVFGLILLSMSGIMFFMQNNALEKNSIQENSVLEKENRVYSVTAQRVDGNRADTYLLACCEITSLWEIRLKDNYEMASPGSSLNRLIDGNYGPQTDDYYYIVSDDNNGLSVGIKSGEDQAGFFYAEGSTESKGTITCKDFKKSDLEFRKDTDITITNGTDYDMAYMAVWLQYDYIMVFSDVKAGETLNLKQAIQDGRCVYERNGFTYEKRYSRMVPVYDQSSDKEYEYELDDMAALLVGLGIAEKEKPRELGYGRAIIVGLVKDYDKVIDDECNETSYGCFYTYTQQDEDLIGNDAEETKLCDYYEDLIAAARECIEGNVVEEPEDYYDFSYIIYRYGASNGASEGLGYLIEDIDGNGTDELFFGQNDEPDSAYNGVIYDIYTISDGELVHVLSGGERDRYYFCENGMIANEGSGGASISGWAYYFFEGAELNLVEAILYNGLKDSDNPWFYSTQTDFPDGSENAESISEEQAQEIMEKYVYERPIFIPFVEE